MFKFRRLDSGIFLFVLDIVIASLGFLHAVTPCHNVLENIRNTCLTLSDLDLRIQTSEFSSGEDTLCADSDSDVTKSRFWHPGTQIWDLFKGSSFVATLLAK